MSVCVGILHLAGPGMGGEGGARKASTVLGFAGEAFGHLVPIVLTISQSENILLIAFRGWGRAPAGRHGLLTRLGLSYTSRTPRGPRQRLHGVVPLCHDGTHIYGCRFSSMVISVAQNCEICRVPRRAIAVEPLTAEYQVVLLHRPNCKSVVRLASEGSDRQKPASDLLD